MSIEDYNPDNGMTPDSVEDILKKAGKVQRRIFRQHELGVSFKPKVSGDAMLDLGQEILIEAQVKSPKA